MDTRAHRQAVETELNTLLAKHVPDLRVEPVALKSAADFFVQCLLWGSSLGAFGGLWKVLEVFTDRHANVTVKLTYTAEDGSIVNIEYAKLTQSEARRICDQHPPKLGRPAKLLLSGSP